MSTRPKKLSEPLRIALVWETSAMRSQQILNGVCRRAEVRPDLSLRRFDDVAADFENLVLQPLLAWRPHGVIVRMEGSDSLRKIRASLPEVPIVSAYRTPPGLVDTMVLGSAREVARVSRDHLREKGVNTVALWAASRTQDAAEMIDQFRREIPDGPALAFHLPFRKLRGEPEGKGLQATGDWLMSLPKPTGVLSFTSYGAPYLSRVCKKLGLRVPGDIQLIGCDDADACLECSPHLTTVIPTGELIGEAAMEAMLGHLAATGSRPPKELLVNGCTLIARGSTGPVPRVARSVARAADIIQSRAADGLTADAVIRMSRQGRSTFYQQFREATGSSPGRQLRERRIAAACKLLVSSDIDISRVAEKCGFSSANYFSQVFRRETGLPPGEYRRKHR